MRFSEVANNSNGTNYVLAGSWGQTAGGRLQAQSLRTTYGKCSSAYVETRQYFGINPNPDSGLILRNAYVAYNVCTASAYVELRGNRDAGSVIDDHVSMYYNTVNADAFVRLSPRLLIERLVQIYRNIGAYRILVNTSTAINGTTISKATAPMIRGVLNIYGNQTPWLFVNNMYVNQGSLAETGYVSQAYGIRFNDNAVTRARIESANNWIDIYPDNTGIVTAPVAAIFLERQNNYEIDFNPIVVLPTTQDFAYIYRALNCKGFRIATTAPALKYLLQGEVSGVVLNNVPDTIEDSIFRVNPDPGTITMHSNEVGPDVYLWHKKALIGGMRAW